MVMKGKRGLKKKVLMKAKRLIDNRIFLDLGMAINERD